MADTTASVPVLADCEECGEPVRGTHQCHPSDVESWRRAKAVDEVLDLLEENF